MNNVLLRMERSYDYVILDAADAVLHRRDSRLPRRRRRLPDAASGRARTHELTTALDTLHNARVEPLGLVLTGTRFLDGIAALLGNGFRRGQPVPMEAVPGNDEQMVMPPPPREHARPRPSPWPRPGSAPSTHPSARRPSPTPIRPAPMPGQLPNVSDVEATHKIAAAVQPRTMSEPVSDTPSEAISDARAQAPPEAPAEKQEDEPSNASSSEAMAEKRSESAEQATRANGTLSDPASSVRLAEPKGTGYDHIDAAAAHSVAQVAAAGPERTS